MNKQKSNEQSMEACFNEFKIGFFEPFAEDIIGDIAIFYSDNFTVMAINL